jgi:hypothetical protein
MNSKQLKNCIALALEGLRAQRPMNAAAMAELSIDILACERYVPELERREQLIAKNAEEPKEAPSNA